jgi:hypothetical protein
MNDCRLVIQASTHPVSDIDRVVSRQDCYIHVDLNREICEDFNEIQVDLPYMQTTREPGRLLVFKENDFLHAINNMSQTRPHSIETALRFANLFGLHSTELHFLRICSKHKLHLNKYLFTD